jgi:hypothetical protein
MNWEAVTALSTAFTGLVIFLTVIYAARQVHALNEQSKALGAQLEHLRRATQLDGTLAIFEELFSPDVMAAYRFIMTDYDERMKDERYRAEAIQSIPDPEKHKEIHFLRHMERIGTLVKGGLLDSDVLLDFSDEMILGTWKHLKPLVLEQRRYLKRERLWENFEFIESLAAEENPAWQ